MTSNRSGQVTTEYILLAAFMVTILMAISGILNNFVQRAGESIEQHASEVMSQRVMGIPTSWFFASDRGRLPSTGGGTGEGPGGDANGSSPNGSSNSDGGPGGSKSPGGGGGPGGSGPDVSATSNTGTNTAGGDSGGEGSRAAGGEDAAKAKGKRRGTGGVVEVDGGGDETDSNDPKVKAENKKKEEEKNKGGSSLDGKRREFALTNEADQRKGSCEDFDMFRMLKILAIIVLIVLGGAYLMTASGNRGGNKK